jgi:hypothetical protein
MAPASKRYEKRGNSLNREILKAKATKWLILESVQFAKDECQMIRH